MTFRRSPLRTSVRPKASLRDCSRHRARSSTSSSGVSRASTSPARASSRTLFPDETASLQGPMIQVTVGLAPPLTSGQEGRHEACIRLERQQDAGARLRCESQVRRGDRHRVSRRPSPLNYDGDTGIWRDIDCVDYKDTIVADVQIPAAGRRTVRPHASTRLCTSRAGREARPVQEGHGRAVREPVHAHELAESSRGRQALGHPRRNGRNRIPRLGWGARTTRSR